MSDLQPYGYGSVLFPPISYGGSNYSYGCKFYPAPSNYNEGQLIVSGTINSVEDLGGNQYKIICSRGTQNSTVSVYYPLSGETVEYETAHSCGGNICCSKENQRVISYNNDLAVRGSVESIRAVPGDGFQHIVNNKTYLWEILEANAYDEAPDEINYNGEENLPIISYVNSDVNDVLITTDIDASTMDGNIGTGYIDYDEDYLCSVSINIGGTLYELTREIYTHPEQTEPDEGYLPENFGEGLSGLKYWYDKANLAFRIPSCVSASGDDIIAIWMVKNTTVCEDLYEGAYVDVEGVSGVTGLDNGGSDNVIMSAVEVNNAFNFYYQVWGTGYISWRMDTTPGSRNITTYFDGDGNVSGWMRETVSGGYSEQSISGTTQYTYPFYILITKSGTNVNYYAKQNIGDSWELKYTCYPSGLDEDTDAIVGFGTLGTTRSLYLIQDTGNITRTMYNIGNAIGAQHVYRVGYFDNIDYTKEFTLASSNDITSVYNISSDSDMDSSATPSRNHYQVSAGKITLYSESAGDSIKITFEADEGTLTAPGIEPRTFNGQDNFADDTGNINSNIANWRDTLTIQVEDPAVIPSAGESFSVYRGKGVWSTTQSASVYIDEKGNEGTDFELINSDNYHFRKYQGLLLLKESYVETLPSPFCLQIQGKRYINQAVDESCVNEIKHAIENLDDLYVQIGLNGLTATGLSGETGIFSVGGAGFTCTEISGSYYYIPDTVVWGTTAEIMRGLRYGYDTYPYWYPYKTAMYIDSLKRTDINDATNDTLTCGSGPGAVYMGEYDYYIPEECHLLIYPFEENEVGSYISRDWWFKENRRYEGDPPVYTDDLAPLMDNYFGSFPYSSSLIVTSVTAKYSFAPIGISIAEILQRMPEGTVITDAQLRVKFEGFRQIAWEGNVIIGPYDHNGGAPEYIYYDYSEQGTLVASYEYIKDAVPEETTYSIYPMYPEPLQTGSVGFRVIGFRKDTKYINFYDNSVGPTPSGTIQSFGSGLSLGTVTNGEWSIVDVTSMIQNLVDDARISECTNFYLYPSVQTLDMDDSTGAMASYLRSLLPAHSAEKTGSGGEWGYNCSSSGKFTWFESLDIDSCYISFRLPSGILSDYTIQFLQPKAMNVE